MVELRKSDDTIESKQDVEDIEGVALDATNHLNNFVDLVSGKVDFQGKCGRFQKCLCSSACVFIVECVRASA